MQDSKEKQTITSSGAEFKKLLLALSQIIYSNVRKSVEAQHLQEMSKIIEENKDDLPEDAREELDEIKDQVDQLNQINPMQPAIQITMLGLMLACSEYKRLVDDKSMKKFMELSGDKDDKKFSELSGMATARMAEISHMMMMAGIEMEEDRGKLIPKLFKSWNDNVGDPIDMEADIAECDDMIGQYCDAVVAYENSTDKEDKDE